jgi:tetratricopeptide (TPR) repeat protein
VTKLITLFFLLLSFVSLSQDYADKDFYLIDSLDLGKISSSEKELLDTTLIKYHNTLEPRYNELMISECQEKLAINQPEKVEQRILFFLAGGISNIGYLYDEQGDLLHAIDFYHKGLSLYEQIGNKEGQSTSYNNLGVIYSIIGDTAKALQYHNKSLEFKKEINDLEGVAMSYNNIGTIYENLQDNFTALEYFESSLKIREEINDKRGIAMSYDNIGDIYFRENINGKALEYYLKGYSIWEELGNGGYISRNKITKMP